MRLSTILCKGAILTGRKARQWQLTADKSEKCAAGYGLAVANAQHDISELVKLLKKKGVNVRLAILKRWAASLFGVRPLEASYSLSPGACASSASIAAQSTSDQQTS